MTKAFEFPSGWHCYFLLCSDDSYYCGITSNLTKRIRDHFSGMGSGYKKKFESMDLVWYELQHKRR